MFSFSPRTQAILFFMGIFALGLVCGVVAERKLLRQPGPRGRPYDYNRMIERLSHDLALSDEQKGAVAGCISGTPARDRNDAPTDWRRYAVSGAKIAREVEDDSHA